MPFGRLGSLGHGFGSLGSRRTAAADAVGDVAAPLVTTLSPTDGATGVSLLTELVVTFNEDVQAGSGSFDLYDAADDSLVQTFLVGSDEVVISGHTVTMTPSLPLDSATSYYVQIDSGAIEDLAGNAFAGISNETTWNFATSGTSLQPVVANQSLEFGAKTRTGAGGEALDNDGGAITSASIDSGNTGIDWKISNAGIITPNQNGGLTAGPYALVCTFTNAFGSDTATVTVTTSGLDADDNDLAVSYSVSNIAELQAACHSTDLAHSDNILLRTGTGPYNPLQNVNIGRTAASGTIDGVWVPPSLYDVNQPDQGYDLDTGSFVKITKHAGASPVVSKLRFLGNQGGGAAQYFRVTDLTILYTPLTSIVWTSHTSPAITCESFGHTIAIDNCNISSQPDESLAEMLQTYSGISMPIGPAWIQDNDVHRCGVGISVGGVTVNSIGANIWVVGNNITHCYSDWLGMCSANGQRVAWNHWYDIRIQRGDSTGAGLHPDVMQWANGCLSATDIRVIGNRFQNGDYVQDLVRNSQDFGAQGPFGGPAIAALASASITGSVLTVTTHNGGIALTNGMVLYGTGVLPGTTIVFPILSGNATSGACTVAISQSHPTPVGPIAMMATHTIRDSVWAGNLVVMSEQFNLIYLGSWGDTIVHNNTAVHDPVATANGLGRLYANNPDGLEVRYNIANTFPGDQLTTGGIARTATIYDNNWAVSPGAYATYFSDPDTGTGITDLAAQYDTKAGVFAEGTDNLIPGACSAYVNFGSRPWGTRWDGTGRTIDFPWDESGHDIAGDFTDVTGAVISTLTTSNEVTLSGVSATGALVKVSSGTFRVRDGSDVLVRNFSATPYVVPNGYKVTLQNTSSGSGATAVNMTVDVGSTSDTWTITTA